MPYIYNSNVYTTETLGILRHFTRLSCLIFSSQNNVTKTYVKYSWYVYVTVLYSLFMIIILKSLKHSIQIAPRTFYIYYQYAFWQKSLSQIKGIQLEASMLTLTLGHCKQFISFCQDVTDYNCTDNFTYVKLSVQL